MNVDGSSPIPGGDNTSSVPDVTNLPFTRADRIHELSDIDKDVAEILRSAGEAIQALTGAASRETDDHVERTTSAPQSPDELFEKHTKNFYDQIQAVSARLRRQIYALEEANIIAAESQSTESQIPPPPPQPVTGIRPGTALAQPKADPPMAITNGGLGNFDVGWLNSRWDNVGKIKDAELLAEARARLEEALDAGNQSVGTDVMDVDASTNQDT